MLKADSKSLRKVAIKEAELGFAHIARAFNLCNNPNIDYYWDEELKGDAMELLKRIQVLVENGIIFPRLISAAQADNSFQKLMMKVTGDYARRDLRD
jgi:hypothetical protein